MGSGSSRDFGELSHLYRNGSTEWNPHYFSTSVSISSWPAVAQRLALHGAIGGIDESNQSQQQMDNQHSPAVT